MQKYLFGLLIIVLSVAAIFSGWKFFQPVSNAEEVKRGNPLDAKNLPLGDGKVSATAKRGYVMSCQQRFFGGGAFRDGDWIHADGTWDATAKPEVGGDVHWNGKYEIKLDGDKRKLIGNGLPVDHNTGIFPIRSSEESFKYDRNPNSIREIQTVYELPATPQIAATPTCVPMGAIGVLKSGVVIFNALDAGGKDAVAHEIQDKCNGHPQPEGQYHYHNISKCVEEKPSGQHSALIGYALDGFGVFGRYGEGGKELTNADLDECHGHAHEILWDGKMINMYHYHATEEYPYTIGCFKGTPVAVRNGDGGRRPPGGGRPPFPPPF